MSSSVRGCGGELTIYLKHFGTCQHAPQEEKIPVSCSAYLKTLAVLGLLLVYYAQAKVDLVGLFEIWLHLHDLRKGFLGVIQRAIPVVQNTNAIPQFRLLTDTMLELMTGHAVGEWFMLTLGFLRLTRAF